MSDALIERVAREAYGRLLARLVVRNRDIAACEDALADAFVAALRHWPTRGVPDRPEAWIYTAARNRLRDRQKHRAVMNRAEASLLVIHEEATGEHGPDDRLRLLFACAHPAIDAGIRTPLMLQVVLGLTAEQVARAFMFPPERLAKRLVRAKAKIKRAGIPFRLPDRDVWVERLEAVLDAIYAAYGRAWDLGVADALEVRALAREAVYLAEVTVTALPHEPEARGLLALLRYCDARRPARQDETGAFVPLSEQDTTRWDHHALAEAEAQLHRAGIQPPLGRYRLEAAIQSCHVHHRRRGVDNAAEREQLYRALHRVAPSVGAWLGWVAAHAEAGQLEAALAALTQRELDHQPYWALRAELHRRRGDADGARKAYARAIALTANPSVRAWLARRGT